MSFSSNTYNYPVNQSVAIASIIGPSIKPTNIRYWLYLSWSLWSSLSVGFRSPSPHFTSEEALPANDSPKVHSPETQERATNNTKEVIGSFLASGASH